MNQTILITGASSGIGKAIALAFAKQHSNIIISGFHHPDALEKTRQEILSLGSDCIAFCGDLANPDFSKQLVQSAFDRYKRIDCLINNAGISQIGLFQDTTPDDWNQILHTNLYSVIQMTHAVLPHMLHEHNGRIINISSVWGNVGASCEVLYSASKGAVNSFTKALAKELAPSNIQVNAIACGAIHTPMNAWMSPEDEAALIEEIPAGRIGEPEEVADLALQLFQASSYLTGQIITLDGGWQ